ncbi:hypothetical protein DFJ73DRAFT_165430 [Zopfochytrium polystomum]|nr:hypothetical protein DFJ73DRAFT_165430 [Zopfochytrium polystomum]
MRQRRFGPIPRSTKCARFAASYYSAVPCNHSVLQASAKTAVDVAWIYAVTCLASLLADFRFSIRTPGVLFAFFPISVHGFRFAVICTWALRRREVNLFSKSTLKRGPSSLSDENVSHCGSSWPELNSSVIARIGFLWLNPLVDFPLLRPLGLAGVRIPRITRTAKVKDFTSETTATSALEICCGFLRQK